MTVRCMFLTCKVRIFLWRTAGIVTVLSALVGRGSSVDIATRYGLEGSEIESRWERDFLHPSRPVLGLTQPPVEWVPGLFPGLKFSGRGVDHPPPFSTEVIERVELYIYPPPWAFVVCSRVNFTFTLLTVHSANIV
jgi:hypothetical protein